MSWQQVSGWAFPEPRGGLRRTQIGLPSRDVESCGEERPPGHPLCSMVTAQQSHSQVPCELSGEDARGGGGAGPEGAGNSRGRIGRLWTADMPSPADSWEDSLWGRHLQPVPCGSHTKVDGAGAQQRIRLRRVFLVISGMATSPELLKDGEHLPAGTTGPHNLFQMSAKQIAKPSAAPFHSSVFSQESDPYAWFPHTPGSWLRGAAAGAQRSLRPRGPVLHLPVHRGQVWEPWVRGQSGGVEVRVSGVKSPSSM